MSGIRMKGSIEPMTPPAGTTEMFLDLEDGVFKTKNDLGVVATFKGDDGPNNITTQTTTDLTGLLKGTGTGVDIAVAGVDFEAVGAGAAEVSSHENDYDHEDIAHTNRADLDLVSGTNTGDQDLSGKQDVLGFTPENSANKAQASGYASLDANSKVVQDPANATATPTVSKIVIADAGGKVDGWVTDATTSAKGKVALEDATNSTSTAKAATPNSVKTAYDLANAALPKSGGTMTGLQTHKNTADVWTTATDGATVTFDLSLGNLFLVTLGGNRALALSNVTVGQSFAIKLIEDATGSRTVSWFGTIKWPGGTSPTLTTTANKSDTFGFICTGANTFDGYELGKNQ